MSKNIEKISGICVEGKHIQNYVIWPYKMEGENLIYRGYCGICRIEYKRTCGKEEFELYLKQEEEFKKDREDIRKALERNDEILGSDPNELNKWLPSVKDW